ncbi:hypothetical protein FG167_00455 [Lacinutrix sp. WUR7]|uniref:metallophosphoesterase n=1 Tax=Lacinutrix sp. WUR7 TaxID=2653681 RepID=UPI00193E86F6|nr:metallophosphoesterase [Lacinutrix sp. WUR7]QRM87751.1 hypothetical protein FG167_00455 [Lacinutrix sp. WUR7]
MADTIQIASKKIKTRYLKLITGGLNLGTKTSPVNKVDFGGYFQDFQRGRIYTHHTVGTFEVHGGILKKYKSRGEFGRSTFTRRRELGFPKSNEKRTVEGFPKSIFESGEIIYVPHTNGGVSISGSIYKDWKTSSKLKTYGYPVTSNMLSAQMELVFFERGISIYNKSINEKPIWLRLSCPLIGSPGITKTDLSNLPIKLSLDLKSFNKLGGMDGINKIIKGRIALRQVNAKDKIISLKIGKTSRSLNPLGLSKRKKITLHLSSTVLLGGPRFDHAPKLYDLVCKNESNTFYNLSPHCIYSRKSWEDFGILHATDIHVSKRIDNFKNKFNEAKRKHPAHSQTIDAGITALNNWNNGFRDFIRYANAMYKEGIVDGIIATGDLVDYLFEGTDNKSAGGNFKFFKDLLLGRSPYPEGEHNQEELLVPIFTSLGNHDYRVNPYQVYQRIDIPIVSDKDVKQYGPYNLSKKEARILQGGNPEKFNNGDEGRIKISRDTAFKQAIPATKTKFWKKDYLSYYKSYINKSMNYQVLLDKHKLILLDTGPDLGSPDGSWDSWSAFTTNFGFGDSNEEAFQNRHSPNSKGPDSLAYNRLKQIKTTDGIIIVGMHAPPINTFGNEYPHYFRETEHAQADELETVNYIRRHKKHLFMDPLGHHPLSNKMAKANVKARFPNWLTNSSAFKFGSNKELLDNGVSRGDIKNFLKLLCGLEGSKKPIDLLLCGHDHISSEIRLKWKNNRMEYYTDFYSENPLRYHTSKKYKGEFGAYNLVKIAIKAGARVNQPIRIIQEEGNDVKLLEIPPYSKPLNEASNKRDWWQHHKPLLIQGTPLGPTEHTNRTRKLPAPSQPSNEGCKLLIIRKNKIDKILHISRRELSKSNYTISKDVHPVTFKSTIKPSSTNAPLTTNL